MQRRRVFVVLASAAIGGGVSVLQASPTVDQGKAEVHVAWVGEVLKRLQTIKPGMTRKNLLTVFMTEAGLSTGLRCTFVSRDCPYFKVDVEFQAVSRPFNLRARVPVICAVKVRNDAPDALLHRNVDLWALVQQMDVLRQISTKGGKRAKYSCGSCAEASLCRADWQSSGLLSRGALLRGSLGRP